MRRGKELWMKGLKTGEVVGSPYEAQQGKLEFLDIMQVNPV